MADSLADLIATWRKAQANNEKPGHYSVAIAFQSCADELEAVLAALVPSSPEKPDWNKLAHAKRQLLAVLVRDLGYDHDWETPTYGHHPLRHQFAWVSATEGMSAEELAAEVESLKANARAEDEEPLRKPTWPRRPATTEQP